MNDQIETRLACLRAEMREIETRLGHEAVNMLQIRQLQTELRAAAADARA